MQYLYLHGFLSGPGSGKGTFLYRKFQQLGKELIRPDLNDGNFERMTISSQLNLAEKILSDINESVILIGSSLGGYLSLLLAERLPKVKKLVLIAPAFDFSERYLSRMDPALMSQWKKRGFIKLYHYGNQRKERLDYVF